MSDILVRKRRSHASIPTAIFENTKLNWKAKGVLAYLLTKPDGWIVRMKNIEGLSEDDGEKSVRTIIKSLEDNGYLHRFKIWIDGHIDWRSIVSDEPLKKPEFWNLQADYVAKLQEGNPTVRAILPKKTKCIENDKTNTPFTGTLPQAHCGNNIVKGTIRSQSNKKRNATEGGTINKISTVDFEPSSTQGSKEKEAQTAPEDTGFNPTGFASKTVPEPRKPIKRNSQETVGQPPSVEPDNPKHQNYLPSQDEVAVSTHSLAGKVWVVDVEIHPEYKMSTDAKSPITEEVTGLRFGDLVWFGLSDGRIRPYIFHKTMTDDETGDLLACGEYCLPDLDSPDYAAIDVENLFLMTADDKSSIRELMRQTKEVAHS